MAGAVIMTWDICTKIAYFNFSRFASIEVKQIYLFFLFFRPCLILLSSIYNLLLDLKTMMAELEKDSKKYKDDIAY